MNEMLDKISKEIIGVGGKVVLVGGYVRDTLMGIDSLDIDIEIYNITPEKLLETLSKFGEVDAFGESFGILKIKSLDIDFAQPRTERKIGEGSNAFDCNVDPFMSFKEASMRRDFTINAIMKDYFSGEIIDEWDGLFDIKNKIIRHINDDTFMEDPHRVFRGARFASTFGFSIAEETIKLCKKMSESGIMDEIPVDRVTRETFKAFKKGKPGDYFKYLKEFDIIDNLFPNLSGVKDFNLITELYELVGNDEDVLFLGLVILSEKEPEEVIPYFTGKKSTLKEVSALKEFVKAKKSKDICSEVNEFRRIRSLQKKVSGEDIMNIFNLNPSKEVGILVKKAFEIQLSDESLSKEEIIQKIKENA